MKKVLVVLLSLIFLISCENKENITENGGTINIEKFLKLVNDGSAVGIDTRSYDEYNGWDLKDNGVNGHIKGSINIPEINNLKQVEERKQLNKETNYVVYGDNSENIAKSLLDAGYKISILENPSSIEKVNKNDIERLDRYEMLLPAEKVNDLVSGKEVKEIPLNYLILNVEWDEEGKGYEKGHIPGAEFVHLGWIEEGPMWNKIDDERLAKEFGKLGITKDKTLIIYSSDFSPAGRFYTIAKYAGVKDVRILNGGFQAWQDKGYNLETGKSSKEETNFGTVDKKDIIIDLDETLEAQKSNDIDIIDIRTKEEYIGETSGYDYIVGKGRIAGAKLGKAGEGTYSMKDYRAIKENYMRPYNEILNMWKELGINLPEKKSNIFYCGTGWRASEVLFYANAMGYDNVQLYDGGWNEWSQSDKTKDKIEVGE